MFWHKMRNWITLPACLPPGYKSPHFLGPNQSWVLCLVISTNLTDSYLTVALICISMASARQWSAAITYWCTGASHAGCSSTRSLNMQRIPSIQVAIFPLIFHLPFNFVLTLDMQKLKTFTQSNSLFFSFRVSGLVIMWNIPLLILLQNISHFHPGPLCHGFRNPPDVKICSNIFHKDLC